MAEPSEENRHGGRGNESPWFSVVSKGYLWNTEGKPDYSEKFMGRILPLAISTSICRSNVTICSGLNLFVDMTRDPPCRTGRRRSCVLGVFLAIRILYGL